MILFFCDLETTGTDPAKHGIIQIGGIIDIGWEVKMRINLLTAPFEQDIIEADALGVTGRKETEIKMFPNPRKVYQALIFYLNQYVDRFDRKDKFYFIGYNSHFDDVFLRAWFKKNYNEYYGSFFYWPPIDVANMAAVNFMESRHGLSDFKLMTVASAAGISIDPTKVHDAMYDIEITRHLFYRLYGVESVMLPQNRMPDEQPL